MINKTRSKSKRQTTTRGVANLKCRANRALRAATLEFKKIRDSGCDRDGGREPYAWVRMRFSGEISMSKGQCTS